MNPNSEADRDDLTQFAGRECLPSELTVSKDTPRSAVSHRDSTSCASSSAPTSEFGLNPEVRWLGTVKYEEALALQESLVAEQAARTAPPSAGVLLLLEHEPVYTIGRTRDQSSLRDAASLPHPVVEINRGGQATYHGPGQLVGYPILDLKLRGEDLHRYLRDLEEMLIVALGHFNVEAGRREGLTGVWVGDRKIASIGIGVRRWVSMHGFALNVCGDMAPFSEITPCGIAGVEMTNLEREAGRSVTVREFADRAGEVFVERFSL